MPLGGRDAGCNVWAQDGQLCLYLSKSGAFDENGDLLKLGSSTEFLVLKISSNVRALA